MKIAFRKFQTKTLLLSCCLSLQTVKAIEPDKMLKCHEEVMDQTNLAVIPSEEKLRSALFLGQDPLSEMPLQDVIEMAYGGDTACRTFVIKRIYHDFISPKAMNIDIKKLLKLDTNTTSIKHLIHEEIFLICDNNPDNILASNWGKSVVVDLKVRAESDPASMHTLAILLSVGYPDVLDKDSAQAIALLTKAADQGFVWSQYSLGLKLMNGCSGVLGRDPAQAIALLTKAADQGLAAAQYQLGMNLTRGILGVLEKDLAKAIDLFTVAADQGYAAAQYIPWHVPYEGYPWYSRNGFGKSHRSIYRSS